MTGWIIGGCVLALFSLAWIFGASAEVVRGKSRVGSIAYMGAILLHLATAVAAVWMFTKAAGA